MTVREQLDKKYGKPQTSNFRQQLEAKYKTTTPIQLDNNSLGQKIINAGNIAGKGLETAAKFTGIKSAVDLLGTAGEGFQYAANKLFGFDKENEQLLAKPQSESMRKANEQGTMAGIKDVAGKSLEVAASAAPFAKGTGVALKTPAMIEGFAKKFPTIARYSGYGLTGAGYGTTFGASQGLKKNDDMKGVMKEALEGAATGLITGVAVPAAIEGTVRAAKNVAAVYSGVPKEALEQAFNNPEKVGQAARQYSKDPNKTNEILNKANKSLSEIKKARSEAYEQSIANIESEIFVTKTGENTGRVYIKNPGTGVFEPTELTIDGVKQNVIDTFKKFRINQSAEGFDFSKSPLPSSQQKHLQELADRINNWDDVTPLGLNNLKQIVDSYRLGFEAKQNNAIVQTIKKNLDSYVNEKVPQIGEMNTKYTKDSAFIDALQKEIFGKTSTMADNTKLNRLLSIFNQKSDLRKQLIKELGEQTGTDLINEITGAAMSSWLPTGWVQRFVLAGSGLTGFMNPGVLVAAPAASPRIVGKTARILGQTKRLLTPTVKNVGIAALNKLINK